MTGKSTSARTAPGAGSTRKREQNASNLKIGSEMKQARKSFATLNGGEQSGETPDEMAEKPDEVVRNDEVGTRFEVALESDAMETSPEGGRWG